MEKLITILEWITKYSVCGEDLFIVDIPANDEYENQEEFMQKYFGNSTPSEIPAGKYLYYWQSACDRICGEHGKVLEPDAEIEVTDSRQFDSIYLYRIA